MDFKSYKFYTYCAKFLLVGLVVFSTFADKSITEEEFINLLKVVSHLEE